MVDTVTGTRSFDLIAEKIYFMEHLLCLNHHVFLERLSFSNDRKYNVMSSAWLCGHNFVVLQEDVLAPWKRVLIYSILFLGLFYLHILFHRDAAVIVPSALMVVQPLCVTVSRIDTGCVISDRESVHWGWLWISVWCLTSSCHDPPKERPWRKPLNNSICCFSSICGGL